MKHILEKPNYYTKLHHLSQEQDKLLQEETFRLDNPLPPIGEVTKQQLGLRTSWGVLREMFLLPWLLALIVVLWWWSDDIYQTWKSTEETALRFIEVRKKKYGNDYFEWIDDPVVIGMYNDINENGVMPLKKYLNIRYVDSVGAKRRLHRDIFMASFLGIGIPGLFIAILSFRRRAPLYVDREKRLVYTWRKGHVWAQHYDRLWYYENRHALVMVLYGYDKKGRFKPRRFVITPTGNPFVGGPKVHGPVLAAIAHYMAKGRDAVWSEDWQGREGWYLFNDDKPKDFDAQLQKVLDKIKADNINPQADQLAKGWGF